MGAEIVNRGIVAINTAFATTTSVANVFSASITPNSNVSTFRIGVCVATAATCQLVLISSTASALCDLNSGTALGAGQGFTFVWPVQGGGSWAYNFRFATGTTIRSFQLDEVYGGII